MQNDFKRDAHRSQRRVRTYASLCAISHISISAACVGAAVKLGAGFRSPEKSPHQANLDPSHWDDGQTHTAVIFADRLAKSIRFPCEWATGTAREVSHRVQPRRRTADRVAVATYDTVSFRLIG